MFKLRNHWKDYSNPTRTRMGNYFPSGNDKRFFTIQKLIYNCKVGFSRLEIINHFPLKTFRTALYEPTPTYVVHVEVVNFVLGEWDRFVFRADRY